MKCRSKSAIYRVRLDGRSKDERYRTDNSRARVHVPHRSFRGNLPCLRSSLSRYGKKNREREREREFARFTRHIASRHRYQRDRYRANPTAFN